MINQDACISVVCVSYTVIPRYSTNSMLDQKIRVENASNLEQISGTQLAESTHGKGKGGRDTAC